MESQNNLKTWIKNLHKDPILKILAKNSNLTKIQLETFLINLITKKIAKNENKPMEKAYFRVDKKVSRGSFHRTLKQAQNNLISSIYTLLLLGYLRIVDSPSLFSRFLEISNRLKDYAELYERTSSTMDSEDLKLIESIQKDLEKTLLEYALLGSL